MDITFKNRARSTRSGFAHESELFIDGNYVLTATCHYLNRTWERYEFQSVMKVAIGILINREIERLKDEYKKSTGRVRVSRSMEFTSEILEELRTKLSEL